MPETHDDAASPTAQTPPADMDATRPSSRRGRKIAVAVGVLSIVVAAVISALAISQNQTSAAEPARTSPPVETVTVTQQDLTNSATFPGVLSRGTPQVLKGTAAGTITKLPAVGTAIDRGTEVYRVDERPIFAFIGETPLYRPLDVTPHGTPYLTGADVVMVAANLAALGFAPNGTYTDPGKAAWDRGIRAALMKWQESVGLEPTGTLAPGDVVVVTQPMLVSAVTASIGDPATGPLLSMTGTTKTVSVPLTVTQAGIVAPGSPVVIERPDGQEVAGTVVSVGTVVAPPEDASETGEQPKLTVTVAPTAPEEVADIDYSAVNVRIVSETRTDVLAVPLEALIALREGGYALQLEDGTYLPVTVGMFTETLVEVEGESVTDGLTVVTAS